jgi:hypothetical protein
LKTQIEVSRSRHTVATFLVKAITLTTEPMVRALSVARFRARIMLLDDLLHAMVHERSSLQSTRRLC